MIKIIFDTNFAAIPFQFKVDIYSELDRIINGKYEIFFLKPCEKELLKLKYGKPAVELMHFKKVRFIDSKVIKNVDNTVLEYAENEKAVIATQDMELKKKALKKGLAIITLRK